MALALCLPGTAQAFTTVEDLESGQYVEAPVIYPNSITRCSGVGEDLTCTNRALRPDPTDCPAGQVLITLRKYGNVSRTCVPE